MTAHSVVLFQELYSVVYLHHVDELRLLQATLFFGSFILRRNFKKLRMYIAIADEIDVTFIYMLNM